MTGVQSAASGRPLAAFLGVSSLGRSGRRAQTSRRHASLGANGLTSQLASWRGRPERMSLSARVYLTSARVVLVGFPSAKSSRAARPRANVGGKTERRVPVVWIRRAHW